MDEVVIRELTTAGDPGLVGARRLYETVLAEDERIPWEWMERSATSGRGGRTGDWQPDLLIAEAGPDVIGFVYGSLIPKFGGYACYLGVDPTVRGRGTGTRLVQAFLETQRRQATRIGVPLPFVVWESHPPDADAPAEQWRIWEARLKVFARVGAFQVEGLEIYTPNYADRDALPVALRLFLVPMELPASSFDSVALRKVAAGLLTWVYGRTPGDVLFDRSLPESARPWLRVEK